MSPEIQDQLIEAIWREKRRRVEALLGSGADVNGVGSKGWTPLMQAVEMENPAITQLLLDRGADVNRAGAHGYTPLHIAVDIAIDGTIQAGGHPGEEPTALIELLLRHGASPLARDAEGKTALDWALGYNSQKVADILRASLQKDRPQPGAEPKGGPAKPPGSSGPWGGPPSVS